MRFLRSVFVCSLLFINLILFGQPPSDNSFTSPVRIPIRLSGNFGELRSNHFHSGIDIKTMGSTGMEILAAGSGYIGRISVSPGGFGKALYIYHPNGLTTVYGHLQSFSPEIEEAVKQEQYRQKSFSVTLFPKAGTFPVQKGELIALSGNTGSSAGPHLHFEVRRTDGQRPENPLLYPFEVTDNINPSLRSFWMYTGTNPDLPLQRVRIPVRKYDRSFHPLGRQILLSAPYLSFGVETFDYLDHSWNKCGIYELKLFFDEELMYHFRMDDFSFNETRYINSHIDYPGLRETGKRIQRTYALPNNYLSSYLHLKDRGIIHLKDSLSHQVEVLIKDLEGNTTSIFATVQLSPQPLDIKKDIEEEVFQLAWNEENTFRGKNLKLTISAKALYEDTYLSYTYDDSSEIVGLLSGIHHLEIPSAPFHKAAEINLIPDTLLPEVPTDKLMLVNVSESGRLHAAGGEWDGSALTAELLGGGSYAISFDTIPPEIKALNFYEGKRMYGIPELRIQIRDRESGIEEYNGYIDGKWSLFTWDPKSDRLSYAFDPDRLEKGKKHSLTLIVTDTRGNRSEFKSAFYW